MQITHEKRGEYIIIKANGRLDASWSEYFLDSCFEQIRNGNHHLLVDAGELAFLSSAGIRSLVRIHKELIKVNGQFLLIRPQPFVAKTIEMTGFGQWLLDDFPKEIQHAEEQHEAGQESHAEVYVLNPDASLGLKVVDDWVPWNAVERHLVKRLRFPESVFALGTGGAAMDESGNLPAFGEFMAVAGHVVFQPGGEKARPDYLMAEKQFIPEMEVLQALYCEGEMARLFRFAPGDGDKVSFGLSELAEQVLTLSGSNTAAFVVLGETDGLVGAALTKSPEAAADVPQMNFLALRDFLSFSGERVFAGEQALVFGIVSKTQKDFSLLRPLPSKPGLSGHFHAAVFPFQPLENGKIDLGNQVHKFLTGPPPKALLHLIDDNRPATGLGQSAFMRGACWCAPIKKGEDLL
jgi:anti-anti-sigma factor